MHRKLLQLNTSKRLWIELIADLTNLPYVPQLQKYRQRQLVDILKDKLPKSNQSKRQMLTNWVKGQALKQVIGLSARTIMLIAAKTLYWPLLLFNPFVFGSEFLAYRTERQVKSMMTLAKEENELKNKIAELTAVNSNLELIHKTLLTLIGKHLHGSDRLCLLEELLGSVYNGESDRHEEFHMSIDSDRDN